MQYAPDCRIFLSEIFIVHFEENKIYICAIFIALIWIRNKRVMHLISRIKIGSGFGPVNDPRNCVERSEFNPRSNYLVC